MFYPVINRYMLEMSPEWLILMMLMNIDEYGDCYDTARMTEDGCYEDDVILTRRDNQDEVGPPTFVFKPSGYSMGWYKHAWKSPEQSENLSIGEIRKILRLCIEHLAYGREIPKGTTKELISLPMHTYVPSDDIADAMFSVARTASTYAFSAYSFPYLQTFDFRHADAAEVMAAEIIRGLPEKSR